MGSAAKRMETRTECGIERAGNGPNGEFVRDRGTVIRGLGSLRNQRKRDGRMPSATNTGRRNDGTTRLANGTRREAEQSDERKRLSGSPSKVDSANGLTMGSGSSSIVKLFVARLHVAPLRTTATHTTDQNAGERRLSKRMWAGVRSPSAKLAAQERPVSSQQQRTARIYKQQTRRSQSRTGTGTNKTPTGSCHGALS